MTRHHLSCIKYAVLCIGIACFLLSWTAIADAYEKEINSLASAMADKIANAGKKTIAVVDFTDLDGNVTQLGRFIAEELSGALAETGKGFEVVNRNNLKLILQEHKLFETGVIDPKAAMKLGEIAGVEALVTGTITPFTENIRLSVSVLDITTAKVIDNKREGIPRTKDINELLGKGIDTVKSTGENVTSTDTNYAQSSENNEFFDDFNMGPKPDWKPVTGDWTMSNGMYTVLNIQDNGNYVTALENKDWTNVLLTIDVSPGATEASSSDSADRWITARICPRRTDPKNAVCFWMSSKNSQFREAGWFTIKNGQGSEYVSVVNIETPPNKIVQIKIEVKNNVFTSYLDGTQLNQIYDSTFPSGSISLAQWYQTWYGPKIRVAFDNLKVTPLK